MAHWRGCCAENKQTNKHDIMQLCRRGTKGSEKRAGSIFRVMGRISYLEKLVSQPIRVWGVIILKTKVRIFASIETQNLAIHGGVLSEPTYYNVTHPESAQSSWPIQIPSSITFYIMCLYIYIQDRLCGLVVRVSGYRYRGLGFDSRRYQIF